MISFSLSYIAEILHTTLVGRGDRHVDMLLTDSRSLVYPERTLFFAIITAKGNGHDYIDDLYHRGVRAFVVSQLPVAIEKYCSDATFICVPNALKALQSLAAHHRASLSMPIVGITGSNGKTTLKELLYQLLHGEMKVGRSPKSYNSALGVPLSLCGIAPDCDLALIEAGISQPDEMEVLEPIIRPNIGVITNIGDAHQENFASFDEKCIEKLRLFVRSDTIIYCADDEIVTRGLERLSMLTRAIGWSAVDLNAPVYLRQLERHADHTIMHLQIMGAPIAYKVPFTDEGTIHDLMFAITLLLKMKHTLLWQPSLFETLEPISMRLEVIEGQGGMTIINDTYNSDFDSLRIALDYMARRNVDKQPMVLVLSDIEESGTHPNELYRRVASLVGRYPIKRVLAVGSELSHFSNIFITPITCYLTTDHLLSDLDVDLLAGSMVLFKGARTARFERIVRRLERHTHQTILDINLSHMVHNLNYYRALLPPATRMICMVKAFGYGTGAYQVAHTLMGAGCNYLAVALLDEGRALREQGITMPIMVMNPEKSTFTQLIEHRLQPEIYSISLLKDFIAAADSLGESHYPIHLKCDTGMHRLGIAPEDITEAAALLRGTNAVRMTSVFTHLAVADDPAQDAYTLGQLDLLEQVAAHLRETLAYPFYIHALNTAGISRFGRYAWDMVRLGIGLYGISPLDGGEAALKPVAGLRTIVLQVRTLPKGATVGYGRRGVLHRASRIAVLPIGYADGIDRRFGNGAISFRTPDGILVPTVGNICMDTLMIDVTDAPEVQEGSEITLFDEALPIQRMADAIGTIPYEVLSRLSVRIARRYFSE